MAQYDLLIRGARVIDAAQGLDGAADIAVNGDQIAAVGPLEGAGAGQVIDGQGLIASPGWIDLHAHVFHGLGFAGVHPDREAGVDTGVTTVVDPGSSGAGTYAGFSNYIAQQAVTRVLAFLNISISPSARPRHGDWENFNQTMTLKTLEKYQAELLGVKVLASQTHCGVMTIEPVKLAVQAARLSGTRVMCHIGNAPPVIQDVLAQLDGGDIVTHCWHGKPGGLLDREGRPIPAAWEAAERGVLFDIGHGSSSFAFATARRAMAAGLPLHAISTDIHRRCITGPVYDQATTMAKFLHLGMDIADVVRLSTLGPAQAIGKDSEFGTLKPGSSADVTVFRIKKGPITLTDSEGVTEEGQATLEPVYTVRAGRVVPAP